LSAGDDVTDFKVLSVLSRALIHVVRGDLSVITNDLTFMGTLTSPEEVERSKARCSHIGQFVGKLAILEGAFEMRSTTVEELLRIDGDVRRDDPEGILSTRTLRCDLQRARFMLTTLARLVDCRVVASSSGREQDAQDLVCTISFLRRRTTEVAGSYRYFSEFAAQAFGERSVVDAALCDLIVEGHGWRSGVVVSDTNVELTVDIPLDS